MVAQSAAGLSDLVHEMCQTADRDGRALLTLPDWEGVLTAEDGRGLTHRSGATSCPSAR